MIPGRILHRLAARICSTTTLERVVEPAIADLQKEYAGVSSAPRRVRSLVIGYAAIVRVTAICAFSVSVASDEERATLVRTLAWSLSLIIAMTVLLTLPPLMTIERRAFSPARLVELIPQAVPLAIPLGLAVGIALGLRGRISSRATTKSVLLAAMLGSVVSCTTMVWVMPVANQSYREAIAQNNGVSGPLMKGYNEMTLSELRRRIAFAPDMGDARRAAWFFHIRFALAAAPFAISGLLLTIVIAGAAPRVLLALFACFVYWAVLYISEWFAVTRGATSELSVLTAVWLPNAFFIAVALLVASSRSWRFRDSLSAAP